MSEPNDEGRGSLPVRWGRNPAPLPGEEWLPRGAGEHEGTPESGDELSLQQLFQTLARRKWLILVALLLGTGGGTYLHLNEPSTYTATAVIRLEDTQRSMAGNLVMPMPVGAIQMMNLSQLQALRSSEVLGVAVDRAGLRLASLTEDFRISLVEEFTAPPEISGDTLRLTFRADEVEARFRGATASAPYGTLVLLPEAAFLVRERPRVSQATLKVKGRQQATEELARGRALESNLQQQTDVVTIRYTSSDPVVAQRVVNAAVEAFRDRNIRSARQSAELRRQFLEEQLEQATAELRTAQDALSAFRTRETVFSLREQFATRQGELQQLEARRTELRADREIFRTMLDRLQEAPEGDAARRLESVVASPQIAQNPVVATLFQQLLQLEGRFNELVSGPGGMARTNPEAVRLMEQIQEARDRLAAAGRSHLESLDARLDAVNTQINAGSAEVRALPTVEAEEARLVQELTGLERLNAQLREELQRARVAEAVEAGRIDVIDFASTPLNPDPNQGIRFVLLGGFLGLVTGAGGAFVLQALDTKIRRRDEVESSLRVPAVGVVPRLPGVEASLLSRALPGLRRRRGGSSDELVTVLQPTSPHAEAFRTIRTNLLFSDAVLSVRSLVVTSPTPAEGKTTTSANLAVTYAHQGLRTLLLDCDLRKARVHRVFGLDRDPGLTEFMLGSATREEATRETGVEGLWVMPSGTHPPNPSELLGGALMRRALEVLTEEFDVVILDSPPLIAGADAAILGSLTDGVLMVVRAGQTDVEVAQQAVRQVRAVGARLLGAVLNDPDGEVAKYSAYYAYQYERYGKDG